MLNMKMQLSFEQLLSLNSRLDCSLMLFLENVFTYSCGSVVEHCVSSAKVEDSVP